MDISPDPASLYSLQNANLNWLNILAELIDNSFDASASRVVIQFGPGKRVAIEDDGVGCKEPEVMLRLGGRLQHSGTRLGRYGVGLKDAAGWLWGRTKITTTCGGVKRLFGVNWDGLAKQTDWTIDDPVCSENGSMKSGTQVECSHITKALPKDYGRLIAELGFTFTPGLLDGRQIQFRFPKRKPTT
ncbi:MAG TPA: ATP-binding protein, partial [Thermoguttaceae bacterium]|nr:ATP-binding protein [Thermoguttaceae bacterium]